MTDQPKHYKISPSSCYRIEQCPGSVILSDGIESESSEYADDGTKAHGLGEECLLLGLDRVECENREMREAVQIYVDFVNNLIANKEILFSGIEYKAPHADIENCGGTVDFFCVYPNGKGNTLHIVDYKHGAGVYVDHVRNRQMQTYAGIWLSNNPDANITEVAMTIVQPRCFESPEACRTYVSPVWEIDQWENKLRSLIGSTKLKAGDHCRWCPAKLVCPKIKEHALELAKEEFSDFDTITPEDEINWLVELASLGDCIKNVLNEVESRIQSHLQAGRVVPGYRLVERFGHRKWSVANEDLEEFFREHGLEEHEYKSTEFASPAQIEKLLGKKVKLADLVEKPKLPPGIAPAEAPGKTYKPGSEFTISIEEIW
jgi:hypothetical protein